MKKLVPVILFVSLSVLPSVLLAQVSAVMNVSARVINSTSIDAQPSVTTLNSTVSGEQTLDAGTLSLKTLPGTSVNFSIKEAPLLMNQNGDQIEIKDLMIRQSDPNNGEHHIRFSGKVNSLKEINSGNYQGQLTAVIEYL